MNRNLIMPDEATCPRCKYFDPTHPEVKEILSTASDTQRRNAPCKCIPQFRYNQKFMRTYGRPVAHMDGKVVDKQTGEILA